MEDESAEVWHLYASTETSEPYQAIKKWERLRLLYNGILVSLVIVSVLTIRPGLATDGIFWGTVMAGGAIANVCFCLGPVLEMYLAWLGLSVGTARNGLFIVGTAFTACAAFVTVLSYSAKNIPFQN